MAATVWTDEMKNSVRAMWCIDRLSASEIGAMFKVSRCSILGLIHRMGLDGSRGESAEQIEARRERRRLHNLSQQKVHGERARQAMALNKRRQKPSLNGIEFSKPKATEPPPGGYACVSLIDRRNDQCTWIVGEPAEGLQCGHHVVPGHSWCSHHHAIVYNRAAPEPFVRRPAVLSIAGGVAV